MTPPIPDLKPGLIKVIFFDAAGTLFHLPQGVGHHYAAVLARHGVTRSEAELAAAFGHVWKTIEPPAVGDGPRADDDRGWWRDVVDRVLDRVGVLTGQFDGDAFFGELYAEFVKPAVWKLYPEVEEVLNALAAKFELGVITNFDGRYRAIAEQLGLTPQFRHIVISSEVGADKPEPQIFQAALALARVEPQEALHVGDDPQCDWHGAVQAGLQVFALDRPRNSLLDLLAALRSASS